MQLTWLLGAPGRPVSVHGRAVGLPGLGSPATQLMRAVSRTPRVQTFRKTETVRSYTCHAVKTAGFKVDSYSRPDLNDIVSLLPKEPALFSCWGRENRRRIDKSRTSTQNRLKIDMIAIIFQSICRKA